VPGPELLAVNTFIANQALFSLISPHEGTPPPICAPLAWQEMASHELIGEGCKHIHLAAGLVPPPRTAFGLGRSMPRRRNFWKPNCRYGLRAASVAPLRVV